MRSIIYTIICCFILTACGKSFEPEADTLSGISGLKGISGTPPGPSGPPIINPDGPTILGEKLENPYTVAAMKTAFYQVASEMQTGPSGPQGPMGSGGVYQSDIQTTHYYLRFLPKNDDEYHALDGLKLYPYPLDYVLQEGGSFYSDGPEDNYSWFYTTIKAGATIPNVEHEILAELFLLDNADFIPTKNGKQFSRDLWERMETRSLQLTGNEDYTGVSGPVGPAGPPAGANWRPSGIIKVYDDKKGTIALQGVTVRARRWFTTYEGVTNADGYYSVNGQFKRPANYSIIWSTGNKWVIRKGWFLPAFYNGPKKQGAWDLSIDRGAGATLAFATIHRAAYRMYYT